MLSSDADVSGFVWFNEGKSRYL